jgi:hypothetical protein
VRSPNVAERTSVVVVRRTGWWVDEVNVDAVRAGRVLRSLPSNAVGVRWDGRDGSVRGLRSVGLRAREPAEGERDAGE